MWSGLAVGSGAGDSIVYFVSLVTCDIEALHNGKSGIYVITVFDITGKVSGQPCIINELENFFNCHINTVKMR